MSKLIYDNWVNDNATVTHTVSTGTVTAITSSSNMFNRSILHSYEYETSIVGAVDHTITITVEGRSGDVSSVGILGFERSAPIESVKLLNLADVTLHTVQQSELTQRNRIYDGVLYYDYVWCFDGVNNVRKIEIKLNQNAGNGGSIGSLYLGIALDVNVKPTSLSYKFDTQGTKVRTEGGQVIASKNMSFMKASFTTTATAETDVINKYFDVNYASSVSEPIIFIPQVGENIMMYGTQEKTNSTRGLLAKNGTDWMYETTFNIEEEL